MATLNTHPEPRGNRVEVMVPQGSVDQPGHQTRIEHEMGRGDRGQTQPLGFGLEEGEVERRGLGILAKTPWALMSSARYGPSIPSMPAVAGSSIWPNQPLPMWRSRPRYALCDDWCRVADPSAQMLFFRVSGIRNTASTNMTAGSAMGYASAQPRLPVEA
jgi:hypothetical protein